MVATGRFRARWTAAVTLGTVRDLESVPVLIEALSDPDERVIRAAHDALRFISRNPDRVGLEVVGRRRPDEATLESAQADWREWLRSVKPEMVRD